MGFSKRSHHMPQHNAGRHAYGKNVPLAITLIIIIIAAYAILSYGGSTRQIGQNYTFALQKGAAQNLMLNNGKQFSVYLNYSTPSAAYVYLSSIPIFQGQTTSITIKKGQTVNVSLNGSQYADIELKVTSSNNTVALFSVVQIPSDLKIPTGTTGTVGTPTTVSTTATTTTGSTSISSTAPVTTIDTGALAVAAFNSTPTGALMADYASMYQVTSNCTPSLYNQTFISTQHSSPSGQNTYANVSKVTPYEMTSSATLASAGTYNIVYTTVSRALGSESALQAQFSYPSNTTISTTFTGIFSGVTYSQLKSNYDSQISIGNACAALIP